MIDASLRFGPPANEFAGYKQRRINAAFSPIYRAPPVRTASTKTEFALRRGYDLGPDPPFDPDHCGLPWA
jgi:hypothetical protein